MQWIKEEAPEWDFSMSVLLTLRSEPFFAVLCRVGWLGGIPGLSPPDPSSNPPAVAIKSVSQQCYTCTGAESPPLRTTALGLGCLLAVLTFSELPTLSGPPLHHL